MIKKSIYPIVVSLLLLLPTLVWGETKVFHVVYPLPKVAEVEMKESPGSSRDSLIIKKSRAISQTLATHLEKRLKAASLKDFHVEAQNFEVKVTIGGSDSREKGFIDLLSGANEVEIRPVMNAGGPNWDVLRHALPQGLHVGGVKGGRYLWSSDFNLLNSTLVSASMLSADTVGMDGLPSKLRLVVGPNSLKSEALVGDEIAVQKAGGEGWRSYVLGPVLQSNRDIDKASWRMNSVGGYSTTVSLRTPVSIPKNSATEIAILVDGQLIAILPREKISSHFELTPPQSLPKQQQRNWARAMAGKFMGYIAIPFGITKKVEEKE